MIVYRCDHCGEKIAERLRVTVRTAVRDVHFCSIPHATAWARWAGYYKPGPDGVVDAEIYCGAVSPHGADCKFLDQHTGTHVSHSGEEWA